MADPLESLDVFLCAFSAGLILVCVLQYTLRPHIVPDESKPGLLAFLCAGHIQARLRGEADPQMKLTDLPRSCGTEAYKPSLFTEELANAWTSEGNVPLGKIIVARCLPWWALSHFMLAIALACDAFRAFFVSCIMAYMDASSAGLVVAYKLLVLELLRSLLGCAARSFSGHILHARLGNQVKAGLQLLVARKVCRLGPQAKLWTSAGHLQQCIQDAGELKGVVADSPLVSVGTSAFGVVYTICKIYGLAGALPLSAGILSVFSVFGVAALCQKKSFEGLMGLRGKGIERLDTINHLLDHFKATRLLDNTHLFVAPLQRNADELHALSKKMGVWASVSLQLFQFLGVLMVLIVYFVGVFIRGERVNYETGYLTYMFTTMLSANLGAMLQGLQAWGNLHYKTGQMEQFLRLPERCAPQKGPLELISADFGWPVVPGNSSAEDDSPTDLQQEQGKAPAVKTVLTGLEWKPKAGELVLICGSVGAGKSSLLLSLLGETDCLAGSISLPAGPVAYQPQGPFLLDATIKENVAMGVPDSELNMESFHQALLASQLYSDFCDPKSTLNREKEDTHVGKGGTNLSGGQRARVALARTVYAVLQGAELAILDDPVAQVDNEVMDAAWNAAVVQAMRGATRVVAVNSQVLGRIGGTADRLLLLKDGRVVYNGSPKSALESKEFTDNLEGDFRFSTEIASDDLTASPVLTAMRLQGRKEAGADAEEQLAAFIRDCPGLRKFVHGPPCSTLPAEQDPVQLSPQDWAVFQSILRQLESTSRVSAVTKSRSQAEAVWSLVRRTYKWMLPVLFPTIVSTGSQYTTCWTVRQWEVGQDTEGAWAGFGWWSLLAWQYFFYSICGMLGYISLTNGMCSLGHALTSEVGDTLRSLGMSYFWSRGADAEEHVRRVCNLDLSKLLAIAKVPMEIITMLVHVTPMLYTAPIFLPMLFFAFPVFPRVIRIRKWIVRHLQPCGQMHNARHSIFAKDLFDGATVLRAHGQEVHFDKAHQELLYFNMQLEYLGTSAGWQAELLTWIARAVFILGAMLAIVRSKQVGGEAWMAQVIYVNAETVSTLMASVCNEYLSCVEMLETYKVLEDFLLNDAREPQGGEDPPTGWPAKGAITFENVTFRYAPHLPLALKNVSIQIHPGEKIGVVGKTGSGKSTLVSLLFRLGQVSGGRILVDDVDLSLLRLSQLRHVIGFVPQEPSWFHCSLRAQVSPEHSDAEILAALERCGLDARQITNTSTSPEALSKELTVSDLSVGQQQLLMVARALVRRPRILVLDESTGFLDSESADRLLQVIANQCKSSTVLSIAHRLRFVLSSDRILVLSGGTVVEFDAPAKLLEDKGGYFSKNLALEQLDEER